MTRKYVQEGASAVANCGTEGGPHWHIRTLKTPKDTPTSVPSPSHMTAEFTFQWETQYLWDNILLHLRILKALQITSYIKRLQTRKVMFTILSNGFVCYLYFKAMKPRAF